jgi:polyisoprenoid-binding protein YceI
MRALWFLSAAALSTFAARPVAAAGLEATPASGRILVHVLKKGLFAGFAHDHHFEVTAWRATADVPEGDPSRLSVEAVLAAGSLRDRQEALSQADRVKVDAQAAGPDVLDAAHHPEIAWRAERATLEPGSGKDRPARGTAHGLLTLRGRTRPVDLAFEAERDGESWRVRGRGRVRQSDFGISPFSGFLGTVGVEDELEIEVALTLRPARSEDGSPAPPTAASEGPPTKAEAPDAGPVTRGSPYGP